MTDRNRHRTRLSLTIKSLVLFVAQSFDRTAIRLHFAGSVERVLPVAAGTSISPQIAQSRHRNSLQTKDPANFYPVQKSLFSRSNEGLATKPSSLKMKSSRRLAAVTH
jgi:hypothetical protein